MRLTHQGRLLAASGDPINGPTDVTLSLWNHATGTNTATQRVYTAFFDDLLVQDGYYQVELGTAGDLDGDLLDGDRWVEVTVGSTTLGPRSYLASVPRAANAGGVDLALLDGIQRPCGTGGFATFNAGTSTWSACPTVGTESNPAASCDALDALGYADGTYWIDVDGPVGTRTKFRGWCEMDLNGGGWLLLVHLIENRSASNFMNIGLPDCVDGTNACIKRNVYNAGEADEILIFDHANLDRWVSAPRTANSIAGTLIDLVTTGVGWNSNYGNIPFLWYDGVVRNGYSHHVDNGWMIDANTWNNCNQDNVSNVGSLCIACVRTDSHCGGTPVDTMVFVR